MSQRIVLDELKERTYRRGHGAQERFGSADPKQYLR